MSNLSNYRKLLFALIVVLFSYQQTLATEILQEGDGIAGEEMPMPEDASVTEKALVVEKTSEESKMPLNPKEIKEKVAKSFTKKNAEPFEIIGYSIEPGMRETLRWFATESLLGSHNNIPVTVVNGKYPGPIVILIAAIHGDELNGIEIVRQIMHGINPEDLRGVLLGLPVVNVEGFWRKERYIGDRRDLNRYFPGNPKGSYPARVANLIFTNFIKKGDVIIDLHTGSFYRENIPQLRVDLNVAGMSKLATGFGAITALQSVAPSGSLREAATSAGIPAVVMEVGGPLSVDINKVGTGVRSIRTFLENVGMIDKETFWPNPQPVFYGSQWLRAESGGILINKVKLGETIKKGQVLAEINNPLSNEFHSVVSPVDGTILGRAQNQFVSPGFALFHIGHQKSVEEMEEEMVKADSKLKSSKDNPDSVNNKSSKIKKVDKADKNDEVD